jgi:hypothetical protein
MSLEKCAPICSYLVIDFNQMKLNIKPQKRKGEKIEVALKEVLSEFDLFLLFVLERYSAKKVTQISPKRKRNGIGKVSNTRGGVILGRKACLSHLCG